MSRSLVTLRDATLADVRSWPSSGSRSCAAAPTSSSTTSPRPSSARRSARVSGWSSRSTTASSPARSSSRPRRTRRSTPSRSSRSHNTLVVGEPPPAGVGKALMECAVTWAEELGIGHVATAAASGSREANRFMARLALGPQAVLRVAPTPACGRKLSARYPGGAAGHPGARRTPQPAARAGRSPAAEPPARSVPVAREQGAGDPAGAHAPVALVGDHDLVATPCCARGGPASPRR